MPLIKIKNLPELKLTDLLRRRRTTLKKFCEDLGINRDYTKLVERCVHLGVQPPSQLEFDELVPEPVHIRVEKTLEPEPLKYIDIEVNIDSDINKNEENLDTSHSKKKKSVSKS